MTVPITLSGTTGLRVKSLTNTVYEWSQVTISPSTQAISSAVNTALTWTPDGPSANWDGLGLCAASGTHHDRLTVSVDGVYLFVAAVVFQNGGGTFRNINFVRTTVFSFGPTAANMTNTQTPPCTSTTATELCASTLVPMYATDYMDVMVEQDSGGSLNVIGGSVQIARVG